MKPLSFIRIATRKSPLARIQAEAVRQKLFTAFPKIGIEIIPMSTSGDANPSATLADIGGKGLFTKELEESLLTNKIDIAVHSLKDMETRLPSNLIIAAMLERENPGDVLIAPDAKTLSNLAEGAKVGTSSVRRAALLKILRPDLNIVPFRGNVTTRLEKLDRGEVDATVLAIAGLKRLNMEDRATEIFDTRHFIPAVGQGIIAVECLEDNKIVREMLKAINHAPTSTAASAERSMLAVLDGSCRTPIGGYARFEGEILKIDAIIADKDGKHYVRASKSGKAEDAQKLGQEIARELLANGGRECLKN